MARSRFTATGFIRIQVSFTTETDSIDDALNRAEKHFDELAHSAVKVLKDKAANLAHDLSDTGTTGVVEAISVQK